MRTILTTLLTAALTALVGAPALEPYTSLAGDETLTIEEKAAPTTLTVGEIVLAVEKPTEVKPGEKVSFIVVAKNVGDKKGKASAKARVSVLPDFDVMSRMMPIAMPVGDLQIEASLDQGGTTRIPLTAEATLEAGATVSIAIGEGDRWVEAASFKVPEPPAAEPTK